MASVPLQTSKWAWPRAARAWLDARLEAERDQVGLWLPVAMGGGISLWFLLPGPMLWAGSLALLLAAALALWLGSGDARGGRALAGGMLAAAAGMALVWGHSQLAAAPVIARPVTTSLSGVIVRTEPMPARQATRLTIAPTGRSDLPPRLRLTLADRDHPSARLVPGQGIGLRARLMPPPGPSLPGGYDFAQRAWFDRIGAVGTVIGRPVLGASDAGEPLRASLSRHILAQLPGSAGGIVAALASGDRGAIAEADEDAMRRSGLAHLLSISGLHVTALVGGVILLLMRLLALHQPLARRGAVPLLAAAGGALAGVGYTLLTGAEVPTVRSCIAALLVLGALALGREAVTLRLVAAGAMLVLILWPEAIVGPSFQLSFAAVTAIVALHSHPRAQGWFARRDEGWLAGSGRFLLALIATGLVIEAVLAPIALFHFHKAGVYGALANVIAIPLTTFVIMPAAALALALDAAGLGAPAWWVTGQAVEALIGLAHGVATAPGAVIVLPRPPAGGFALAILGLLWVLIWSTGWRWWGLVPLALGSLWMASAPVPDLLVTGDGRHVAVRLDDGRFATLRPLGEGFAREQLAEAAGLDLGMAAHGPGGDTPEGPGGRHPADGNGTHAAPPGAAMTALPDVPGVQCNADMCRWTMARGGRRWQILAARSRYQVDAAELIAACAAADIVIADRWLPPSCAARWLTLDRDALDQHGGAALFLASRRIDTAIDPADRHPWRRPDMVSGNDEADPTASPES